jgi:hypothetical protein
VFARQPCDPIPRLRDVGQWLCVPPFRVVCLYQAFTLAVNDAGVTRTPRNDGPAPGVPPGGPWAPRPRRSTGARSRAASCPRASVPAAESKPHASLRRRAASCAGGRGTRAGTRRGSRPAGAKGPRGWAKTAGRGAQAAGWHGNRRPGAGRPAQVSYPAASQQAGTPSGATQRLGRRVDCPP